MICPRCRAETRVVSSRPHAEDPTVIVRRRDCTDCLHRFETQEGTHDIARQRAKWASAKRIQRLVMPEDKRKALNKRRALLDQSRAEAKATGRPVAEIRREWGISPASPQ